MAVTETALGELGIVLGGEEVETGETYEVRSPYDRAPVAVVHRAGPDEVERAIAGAAEAFATTRRLPSWQREQVLERISVAVAERREELARTIALEAGKPIKTARVEVDRASFTFRIAAEEAKRNYGEVVPLDWLPGNEGREALIRRIPLGPVTGITPFNFPLNLRRAQGCARARGREPDPVRPASQTPCSSLRSAGSCSRQAGRRAPSQCCRARPTRRGRSSRTTGSSCSPSPAARSSAGA
jgi:NAD-dependent aldehyde dehydrogenases